MTMLTALVRRYERMAAKGEAPPVGYADEYIHFAIVINSTGQVRDIVDLRDGEGKKSKKARRFRVPQAPSDRRGQKIVPGLFWDPAAYALGLPPGTTEKDNVDAERKFEAFKTKHLKLLSNTKSNDLLAFRKFLCAWNKAIIHGHPLLPEMPKAQIAFRLDGLNQVFIHECDEAKEIVLLETSLREFDQGMCLVTGAIGSIERLHPPISGFPDADKIVSFNETAFESYGKKQGANAPVSVKTAFAYTACLSGLLTNSRHRVQIGDTTVVFWAEPRLDEDDDAKVGEDLMAAIFGGANSEDEPPPDDKAVESDLLSKLSSVAKGKPSPGLKIDNAAMPFYVLGLSPNAARISIRFWLETTLGDLAAKLTQHFEDMRLEPPAWAPGREPTLRNLISQLAPMRIDRDGRLKIIFDNAPEHLIGELARAVLSGGEYPYAILPNLLQRLKADRIVTGLRVALIKAVLTRRERTLRSSGAKFAEETEMTTDRFADDIGRRLGRLFALYEKAQDACFEELNSGLRDKFYASAMATPQYVFPSIDSNYQNHLSRIRKGRELAAWVKNHKSTAAWLDREIGALNSAVGKFPMQLTNAEQGQFVIGYYQQKYERKSRPPEAETGEIGSDEPTEDKT